MDIKLRRYYWVVLLFLSVITGLPYFFGDVMIIPYSTGSVSYASAAVTIGNDVYVLDDSVIHEMEIQIDREDYESMLETYGQTGLKEYFKADIVIDGVTVEEVGVRLKGQLTLQQAFRSSSAVDDMQLPFLVKFDEYVDGQNYQGITELAVRIGSGDALLEEPLALYAHELSGATVPRASYAGVKVSDLDPAYYVLCQNIDESYLESRFNDTEGVLYKAGNFVDLSYRGDDQTEYMDDFEQKTQVNVHGFSHLIRFLEFVNGSSDEEFGEQLAEWLDVDALITMMAVNDLVENSDSFSGMNSNYYLYYSPATGRFTILAWDMNLAFGAMMGQGDMQKGGAFDNFAGGINRTRRNDTMGVWQTGGMNIAFQGPGETMPQEGMGVPADWNVTGGDVMQFPGMQGDREMNLTQPGIGQEGMVQRGERGDMNRNGQNMLKDRFFENESFSSMYEDRYIGIADGIYCSGLLTDKLDAISAAFTRYNSVAGLLVQEAYDTEVGEMRAYIEEKAAEVC